MKLGIVGDIHCGPDAGPLLGSRAPAMLEVFGEAMSAFRPDCIIDLGDRINEIASGQDRQRTAWVRRQLSGIGVPVFHLLGNTDLVNLTKVEVSEALGKGGPLEAVELAGVRLVLLDSQDPPFERVGGEIGANQQAWLEAVLRDSHRPALVFCHHPLDEQGVDGHWYFAARPELACARARAPVRRILERCGDVRAVFSGHMHWTRTTQINGIPYVTLGSLVDGGFTHGQPCGAFATVTVRGKTTDVQVAGLLPSQFRLTQQI